MELTNDPSFGYVLARISLIIPILYFMTISMSGSIVVEILTANGEMEPPVPQNVFWTIMEGKEFYFIQ